MKLFKYTAGLIFSGSVCISCSDSEPSTTRESPMIDQISEQVDSARLDTVKDDTVYTVAPFDPAHLAIDTKNQQPANIINFAKTLIGVPYKYGSTDPRAGFDCSGFITYVFKHFHISVPRSSIDFTNVGTEVKLSNALPGDLILFTGTDSSERFVGHMGIVTENTDSLRFIHSTSGKKYGVTITTLNQYYKGRFVKVTRIFNNAS